MLSKTSSLASSRCPRVLLFLRLSTLQDYIVSLSLSSPSISHRITLAGHAKDQRDFLLTLLFKLYLTTILPLPSSAVLGNTLCLNHPVNLRLPLLPPPRAPPIWSHITARKANLSLDLLVTQASHKPCITFPSNLRIHLLSFGVVI